MQESKSLKPLHWHLAKLILMRGFYHFLSFTKKYIERELHKLLLTQKTKVQFTTVTIFSLHKEGYKREPDKLKSKSNSTTPNPLTVTILYVNIISFMNDYFQKKFITPPKVLTDNDYHNIQLNWSLFTMICNTVLPKNYCGSICAGCPSCLTLNHSSCSDLVTNKM